MGILKGRLGGEEGSLRDQKIENLNNDWKSKSSGWYNERSDNGKFYQSKLIERLISQNLTIENLNTQNLAVKNLNIGVIIKSGLLKA